MATHPYNYQRDNRLDLIETEVDITRDLVACTSVELKRVIRIASRILIERGHAIDERRTDAVGVALLVIPLIALVFMLGAVTRPILDDAAAPLVRLLVGS